MLLHVLLLIATQALALSGVKGGTSWRGEGIAGLQVRAYRSLDDMAQDRSVAVSDPSAADGSYTLDLPPGRYYFAARNYKAEAAPGDYFCYFSGAPVEVLPGKFANVGFNLIRVPREEKSVNGAFSGISGNLTFQDKPLERAYLYVYKNPREGFKGPAYFIQPVEKGSFRLRLPPGDYWILARKRARGGQFGPVEIGDYFSFYYGNPVQVEKGEVRQVNIEAIVRMSQFEEALSSGDELQGKVVGAGGLPVAGLYVFAYREAGMTGSPTVFSRQTGPDGSFSLSLPSAGVWYLLARENFGGPAADGELYGRFGGEKGEPVVVEENEPLTGIVIRVVPKVNL